MDWCLSLPGDFDKPQGGRDRQELAQINMHVIYDSVDSQGPQVASANDETIEASGEPKMCPVREAGSPY